MPTTPPPSNALFDPGPEFGGVKIGAAWIGIVEEGVTEVIEANIEGLAEARPPTPELR